MNPWLFFWAPQLHLPFGGSVAQSIEPSTSWFFDSISPAAGDANVEKQAFEVASYGRQLGLITEVLVAIADKVTPDAEDARRSLARLRDIQAEIERIKERDAATLVDEIEQGIARLERMRDPRYAELRQRLERALGSDGVSPQG
jgi:hypothetical protein